MCVRLLPLDMRVAVLGVLGVHGLTDTVTTEHRAIHSVAGGKNLTGAKQLLKLYSPCSALAFTDQRRGRQT